MKNNSKFVACHCCGSIEVPIGEEGLYYVCSKCGWENDEIQNEKPNYSGGANELSLNEYKAKYEKEKNKNKDAK